MKVVSQEQALSSILSLTKPLGIEYVLIENCYGRTLAKNLVSKIFSPSADCSAMDGYGINFNKSSSSNTFRLVGEISAGKSFRKNVLAGEAVRIFTGAIAPTGVNKVIPQEYLLSRENDILQFSQSQDNFIRSKGSNFKPGFTIKKNVLLNPNIISLLASMNLRKIPVFKKPKVAILSIGNELSYPGRALTKFKISSSNAYGIKAFMEAKNADVILKPIIRDDLDLIAKTIKECLEFDMVITIGGASVGKFDLVHDAAIKAGIKFSFTQVNMRPGKPFKAGKKKGTIFLSLPGNSVSSFICAQIFLGPALEKFRGNLYQPAKIEAYLLEDIDKNGSRKHYMRSQIVEKNHCLFVKPFRNQDSHNLTLLCKANSLIIRDRYARSRKRGQKVEILRL